MASIAALGAALLACTPAIAAADHPERSGDGWVYQQEAQILGPEHAAEHERIRAHERRALRRWYRLPRRERHRQRRRARREALGSAEASAPAASAASVGRWTVPPFTLPNYAIHAALLPTGKVLFWGWPPLDSNGPRENYGQAALWDPKQGTGPQSFVQVPPPEVDHDGDPGTPPVPATIFCSGQSQLPSGELLLTGGNLVTPSVPNDAYTKYAGTKAVLTFDPWTESWTLQPSMLKGRWYPSQVLLADGRTVMVGGYTEDPPGGVNTNLVEEYTPAASVGGQGSIAPLSGAERSVNLYPRLHLMPDGDVLMTGAGRFHVAKLSTDNPGSGSWTGYGGVAPMSEHHIAGTAVLPSGDAQGSWLVTSIGGHSVQPDTNGNYLGTTTVETLDYRSLAAGWSPEPPLQVPRSHHNTVLLPDGSMVTVGGGVGNTPKDGLWAIDPEGPQRQVEVFDPVTKTWRLGPAEVEDRAYHSTALLLPDGRIWSAGDDVNPTVEGVPSSFDTAELYTPAALYGGKRPRIRNHPRAIRWDDEFTVRTYTDAAPPVKAVLMAPAAVTHGVDMAQRRIELEVTQPYDGEGTIKLRAPRSPEIAPPGYYMLILLSDNGVYSGAPWTRLGADAPDAP